MKVIVFGVDSVDKHWPETREFITQTIGLWNRWIRRSYYYNRVANICPLYAHVTPILQCVGPCYLYRSFRSIFLYNTWRVKVTYYVGPCARICTWDEWLLIWNVLYRS